MSDLTERKFEAPREDGEFSEEDDDEESIIVKRYGEFQKGIRRSDCYNQQTRSREWESDLTDAEQNDWLTNERHRRRMEMSQSLTQTGPESDSGRGFVRYFERESSRDRRSASRLNQSVAEELQGRREAQFSQAERSLSWMSSQNRNRHDDSLSNHTMISQLGSSHYEEFSRPTQGRDRSTPIHQQQARQPFASQQGFTPHQAMSREFPHHLSSVNSAEVPRRTQGKLVKIENFPDNIPPTDKYHKFLTWVARFKITMRLGGIVDQREMADHMCVRVGSELGNTIIQRRWLAEERAVGTNFKFFDELEQHILNHFRSMTDSTVDLHKFKQLRQKTGEDPHTFQGRVIDLADKLEIGDDNIIRAVLIEGLNSSKVRCQARLMKLTAKQAVEMAAVEEATAEVEQQRSAEDERYNPPQVIAAIGQKEQRDDNWQRGAGGGQFMSKSRRSMFQRDKVSAGRPYSTSRVMMQRCKNCGRRHERDERCAATDETCYKCQKKGHFKRMCFGTQVNSVNIPGSEQDKNHLVSCSIGCAGTIELLIDSGAEANVLTEADWKKLKRDFDSGTANVYDIDTKPKLRLTAAGNKPLTLICTFKAWIEATELVKRRSFTIFAVAKDMERSLLSRVTAKEMRLLAMGLEVNAVFSEDDEDCQEFPSIPGEVSFEIRPEIPPRRQKYVSIPAHFLPDAKLRLQQMLKVGIIEEIFDAPDWISPLISVPKGNNNYRLVVNMRAPNEAIVRQPHTMPRVDSMKEKLKGAKYFSKMDLANAFHHVKLSEESRGITTFSGPDNRLYRFKRLVFGVNCAPELFQRKMEEILHNIPNIIIYIDDILVYATSRAELEEITAKVKEELRKNNLSLNLEKCEFGKESLTFLGHHLSAAGLSIDENKIKDVKAFRSPQTASELKSFLGLTSYLREYIKDFADLSKVLREALKGSFEWNSSREEAFENLKEQIIKCTTTLGYFDINDKTILTTDASPDALGAVLIQKKDGKERIISFASKALTETEKRYPQGQREALAVVWAAEHFHYYLLGSKFTIRTDNKGVKFIFDRKSDGPKRMLNRAEGWAMRLDAFNFDMEFIKGTDNIADPSSRLFKGTPIAYEESRTPCEICSITLTEPVPMDFGDDYLTIGETAFHTTRDDALKKVLNAIDTGNWNDESINNYKAISEELNVLGGVIVRTGLAVIPKSLQPKALRIAHKGHPGMTKMKSILKDRVWWTGLGSAVESWVGSCKICTMQATKGEFPVPMQRTKLPEAPWDYLAIDFCGPYKDKGDIYILGIVDYYSRFIVAVVTKAADTASVIAALTGVFDIYGNPEQLKSDNATCFKSLKFKEFSTRRGIKLVNSWPLNPQQNGLAENSMKLMNKAMKTSTISGQDYRDSLKEAVKSHNSSRHSITNEIPNDIMFGRRLRQALPLTKPAACTIDAEAMRNRDWFSKVKSKHYEDAKRGARDATVSQGSSVLMENPDQRKGQSKFGEAECIVTNQQRGNLTVLTPDGKELNRDITRAKRFCPNPLEEKLSVQLPTQNNENTQTSHDDDENNHKEQLISKSSEVTDEEFNDTGETPKTRKSARKRNQPDRLGQV